MTPEELEKIYAERMEQWKPAFLEKNATPVLMLGVGHGPNQGDLVLQTMKELDNATLAGFIVAILAELRGR